MRLDNYSTDGFYDEMFDPNGQPRGSAEALAQRLISLSDGELERRQKAADLTLLNMGITFAVYGNEAGAEKVWPFDIVPRIVEANEWKRPSITRLSQPLVFRIGPELVRLRNGADQGSAPTVGAGVGAGGSVGAGVGVGVTTGATTGAGTATAARGQVDTRTPRRFSR